MSDPIEDGISGKEMQRRERLLDEREADRKDAEAYEQEHMTPEQWKAQEARDIESDGREEAFDRFREDAESFIRSAAAADTHSSDRDPGAVDPWEDR